MSQPDLAAFLKTTTAHLQFHLYHKKRSQYRQFQIPKASGESREIGAPPFQLLRWQRDLLPFLNQLYKRRPSVHGFVPRGSILTNAKMHRNRRLVLSLDLQNFFPSIHFGRVRGVFMKHPFLFSHTIGSTLAQICTNGGILPQGAATSPVISNLVCRKLDTDLARFATAHNCIYTRFADDITFSTNELNFSVGVVKSHSADYSNPHLGDALIEIISRHRFSINDKKTRIRHRHRRQEVTGLVVNNEVVNVRRDYIRNLRLLIHKWHRDGYIQTDQAFRRFSHSNSSVRYGGPDVAGHLRGKLEFLRMIRGRGDRVHAKYSIAASKLPGYGRSATIEGSAAAVLEFLSEVVWIIAAYDASGSLILNGTAFALGRSGFVTAAHVISDAPPSVVRWQLIRAASPHDQFAITGYKHHNHFDLALLTTDAYAHGKLRRSKLDGFIQDQHVTVVGFPTWNTSGDKLLKVATQIVQRRTWSGRNMAGVGYSLLSGTSGGPVLDRAGHVCGVVVSNKDDPALPNGIISVEHIDQIPNNETRL